MAFDREAARQAGYSDAEIDAYLAEEANKKKTAPAPVATSETPPDSTTVVANIEGGLTSPSGAMTTGTAAALGAAAVGLPAAAIYAGKKILSPAAKTSADVVRQGMDLAQRGVSAMESQSATNAMREGRLMNRPGFGGPVPSGPVAPTAPAPSPILDAAGRPFAPTAPVAPTAPPAAPMAPAAPQAAQPTMIDRATQMVRQLALDKVVKGGLGAAAAVTPGNIGQNYNFPQSGPLRGSEINPMTGRPWTEQELAAYRAQYGQ